MSDSSQTTAPPVEPFTPVLDSAGRATTPPTADQIAKATADIEKRWNMPMSAVTVMMHNHIFGTTTEDMLNAPTADAETVRRRRKKHRQQQQAQHKGQPHPTNPSTGG